MRDWWGVRHAECQTIFRCKTWGGPAQAHSTIFPCLLPTNLSVKSATLTCHPLTVCINKPVLSRKEDTDRIEEGGRRRWESLLTPPLGSLLLSQTTKDSTITKKEKVGGVWMCVYGGVHKKPFFRFPLSRDLVSSGAAIFVFSKQGHKTIACMSNRVGRGDRKGSAWTGIWFLFPSLLPSPLNSYLFFFKGIFT